MKSAREGQATSDSGTRFKAVTYLSTRVLSLTQSPSPNRSAATANLSPKTSTPVSFTDGSRLGEHSLLLLLQCLRRSLQGFRV